MSIHILRLLTAIALLMSVFTSEAADVPKIHVVKGIPYVLEPVADDVSVSQTACIAGLRLYSGLHGLEYTGISATDAEYADEKEDILVMHVAGTTSTSGVIVRNCSVGGVTTVDGKIRGLVVIHKENVVNGVYEWVLNEADDKHPQTVIIRQNFDAEREMAK